MPRKFLFVMLSLAVMANAFPATASTLPKPATKHTVEANRQVREILPFHDTQDFEDAKRGLIAAEDIVSIKNNAGRTVWDLEAYKTFLQKNTAPDEVNPSLWRNAQLNFVNGLFKVADRIYQVRGYDLSNITFIQGDTGWIVFDPLISQETARAALNLLHAHVPPRPVVAVVYSHSHVDHYGGVRGVVDAADVRSGKVQILAPEHFTEHAVSENVIAGNAMSRRATYMYGAILPRGERGSVSAGLGMGTSSGTVGLLPPTREITFSGEEVVIDGVRMVFQLTPGTEAPVEMNTWFPQFSALWMAENTCSTMHNILTLRGAEVRDALKWATYLQESMELWGGQAEVRFQAHHWPRWGNENILRDLGRQRDMYKYMHDQSVRLMNMGYTGEEIAESLRLPRELENFWGNRGYYGTLRHNSRAIYQRYMGWYDGHPASLNNLPPQMVAPKYVEYMGGEANIVQKAKISYDQGEYRWVAEVIKHVVFANPSNTEAKALLADALEQMGYQAESGAWRSIYLQGAWELRNPLPRLGNNRTTSLDTLAAMTPSMLFDYMAVRINPDKVAGKKYIIHIMLTDSKEEYTLTLENSVLHHAKRPSSQEGLRISLEKATLVALIMDALSVEQAVSEGKITLSGDKAAAIDLWAALEKFDRWFPIVTP